MLMKIFVNMISRIRFPNRSRSPRSGLSFGSRQSPQCFFLGGSNVYSQIAVFFSKMAVVTFGGAYAVLAYVAQQAVDNYHWLKPGEMLDGLDMAETTPGPLIMVLQFVGFMAAYPPLLPLDFPRRSLHRTAARQQGSDGRALGDHGGSRRRHSQSCHLVRDPCDLSSDGPCALARFHLRTSGSGEHQSVDAIALDQRGYRHFPFQGRSAANVRRFGGRRRGPLCNWSDFRGWRLMITPLSRIVQRKPNSPKLENSHGWQD